MQQACHEKTMEISTNKTQQPIGIKGVYQF